MNRPLDKTRFPINPGASVRDFFGPAPGALKDHLNGVELSRITITALTAGGGTLALLQAILLNVGKIFPAPTDAAVAAVFVTLIIEALRRLGHGPETVPVRANGRRNPGETVTPAGGTGSGEDERKPRTIVLNKDTCHRGTGDPCAPVATN